MQLTEEANVSSPVASWGTSPAPSYDGSGTENGDEPVSLMLILEELRGVGKEVKELRKDTKTQQQDIRGELDKPTRGSTNWKPGLLSTKISSKIQMTYYPR